MFVFGILGTVTVAAIKWLKAVFTVLMLNTYRQLQDAPIYVTTAKFGIKSWLTRSQLALETSVYYLITELLKLQYWIDYWIVKQNEMLLAGFTTEFEFHF